MSCASSRPSAQFPTLSKVKYPSVALARPSRLGLKWAQNQPAKKPSDRSIDRSTDRHCETGRIDSSSLGNAMRTRHTRLANSSIPDNRDGPRGGASVRRSPPAPPKCPLLHPGLVPYINTGESPPRSRRLAPPPSQCRRPSSASEPNQKV